MFNTYANVGYYNFFADTKVRTPNGSAKYTPQHSVQIKNKKRRVNNRRGK